MKSASFNPFIMPDLRHRPDGTSKSLKESYIYLASLGFPDKSLFIFPEGEFGNYKGEIIDQRPGPGETITMGDRIVLVAAVSGICELLPDLFTDHHENFFDEDVSARGATERLFAIFDSAFIKMLCRLEWIRDIYAGISSSQMIIDYIGALLDLPERKLDQIPPEVIGFVLPTLYGYLGTESALRTHISAVTGINTQVTCSGIQRFPIPEQMKNRLGQKAILGDKLFLGHEFKGTVPETDLVLELATLAAVEKVIPGGGQHSLLWELLSLTMPSSAEIISMQVKPESLEISFESGKSYLGYSSVLRGEADQY